MYLYVVMYIRAQREGQKNCTFWHFTTSTRQPQFSKTVSNNEPEVINIKVNIPKIIYLILGFHTASLHELPNPLYHATNTLSL
jgi:hypothetical protein